MTAHATAPRVEALRDELRRRYGWELPASRLREVQRLAATTDAPDAIAEQLAVGETSFFRDRKVFHALEKVVLPDLIRSRMGSTRTISIWSAGCATGEEPYSVAALLVELLPDRRRWLLRVLGTDISRRFLAKAQEGRYGNRSLRALRDDVRARFFDDRGGGTWAVKVVIRSLVSFSTLNLVTDRYPSGLDVILCRNVLMYFAPESARRVILGLLESLGPEGYLIVSPVESLLLSGTPLAQVTIEGATMYRRAQPATQPAAGRAVRRPRPSVFPRRAVASPERVRPAPETPSLSAKELAAQARVCADRGELDAARALCVESLGRDRLDPRLHYLLARILEAKGDLPRALESLGRALYLEHDFAMAHVAAGMVARKLGRRSAAVRHLRAALSLTSRLGPGEIPPEADGMSARGLAELVGAILSGGV